MFCIKVLKICMSLIILYTTDTTSVLILNQGCGKTHITYTMTQQEGWLLPTERASVSAIILRHILASPGKIAVNVTWMKKRGFNACQTHCSMYPSIFNRFPVIQPVSSKVCHFSTFFCTFWPPLGTPLGQSR